MPRVFISLILLSLFVYSCGTPNEPDNVPSGDGGYKIKGKAAVSGFAQDVVVTDSFAFIAQGEGGMAVINITDKSHPVKVCDFMDQLKGYCYKLAKKDSVIYIAAGSFGLTTISVGDPYHPFVTLTNQGPRPTRDVKVHGGYLLTASSEMGIGIAKIDAISYPDFRGNMEVYGYAKGLCVSPDSAYLLVASGEMGVTILDIKDMQNGFGIYPKVGWIDTDGYTNDVVCNPDQPYAYAACGTAGLFIIDYSDTANVKITGIYNPGGYAKEVAYENNKIYMTLETGGLQIIDVTDPASPKLIGTVKTEYAMGVSYDDKYIYVADENEGFIIVEKPVH